MRSVRNLVQTKTKERFYNDIGSDVGDLLFGFVDVATGGIIANEVQSLLATYEPRIDNIMVTALPRPENSTFELEINYEIVGEPASPQAFSFLLEATR